MENSNGQSLLAFVLMPFNDESAAIFDELIAAPLAQVGYEVRKADSVIDQRSVLSDIVVGINSADLIVADLTGLNPNVFYELGIAHGLGVPTVLITQALDEVPFDLKTYRTSEYSTRFDEAEKLKAFLIEVGREAAEGRVKFASPVSDYLRNSPAAKRLSTESPTSVAVDQPQTGEVEEEPELGTLDLIHAYLQSADQTTSILTHIGEETSLIGDRFSDHTGRMQGIDNTKPGAIAKVYRIAAEVASDLSAYGDALERDLPVLENESDQMMDSGLKWLAAAGPDQPPDDLDGFRFSLGTMYVSLAEGIPSTQSYRDAFQEVKGVTTQLNKASERVVGLLNRMLTVMEKTQSFASRGCDVAQEILETGPMYIVMEPELECFKDPAGTQQISISAALLGIFDRGIAEKAVPVSGEPLQKHARVSWALNEDKEYGESWFRHPYADAILHAWDKASEFAGEEIANPGGFEESQGSEPGPK